MEFNIADLFECVADHVPERVALSCQDRHLRYDTLDDRANRLAHGLAGLGVTAGDHVACYLRTGVEYIETMLACYKLRAVPINVNDRYVTDEVAAVVADADAVALIADPDLPADLDTVAARLPALRATLTVGPDYDDLLDRSPPDRDFAPRSADDHYILYTGGTTGRPKGVMWRQEDIFFAALGGGNAGGPPIERPEAIGPLAVTNRTQRLGPFLPPGDPGPDQFVALALGPLAHASGQWSALGTLLGGGRVVLYPERHMDLARVLELVERERVVMLNLVGDASGRPLLEQLRAAPDAVDTSSLRLLGSGGSLLSADVKHGLLAALPTVLTVMEAIGSSEAPVQAIALVAPTDGPTQSLHFAGRDTTMVVDDDLTPIPPGSARVGRLATTGRVPLGYYNDAEKTAATFVEIDGRRWTLPGDMATVDADGSIRLLGRGSQSINTGGEKVYPEEVEAVLRAHPDVADAVVVGCPDPRFGERVAAVVAPTTPDAPPTLEHLQAHCRGQLAGYKVPRELHVVDTVDRTPAGKPDYTRIRARLTDRPPEPVT
ncbi:MAG TPA: AMP-binding protein [Acidimicrobiia bacterium]|nr:AMP-binding protein [Acidimicrobiia bacterium]